LLDTSDDYKLKQLDALHAVRSARAAVQTVVSGKWYFLRFTDVEYGRLVNARRHQRTVCNGQ